MKNLVQQLALVNYSGAKEQNMNTQELIKLADLLDSRGEHDAAGEVDKLIRNAGHSEPASKGYGGFYESEDEPTDTNVEQPQWMDEEDTDIDMNQGTYAPAEMPDDPTVPGKPDVSVGRRSKEYLAVREVLEKARQDMDADVYEELVDAVGMLAYSAEEAGPPDYDADDKTASVFARLSKVADDLDEAGARKGANMIDAFLSKYAAQYGDRFNPEEIMMPKCPECSNPRDEGETCRYCGELYRGGPTEGGPGEEPGEAIRKIDEIVQNYSGDWPTIIEYLDKLVNSLSDKHERIGVEAGGMEAFLSKHAEGYSEDRKEEADSEQKKRYDEKYHHSLLTREPKRDQERVDREGRQEHHKDTYKPHEGSLSTRYCPEHIGAQMGRVGHGIYQCPLDGNVYNWETGYTTFDGVNVPGGSIAAQTPDSTGYGTGHRIFDSREKTLNVVN